MGRTVCSGDHFTANIIVGDSVKYNDSGSLLDGLETSWAKVTQVRPKTLILRTEYGKIVKLKRERVISFLKKGLT